MLLEKYARMFIAALFVKIDGGVYNITVLTGAIMFTLHTQYLFIIKVINKNYIYIKKIKVEVPLTTFIQFPTLFPTPLIIAKSDLFFCIVYFKADKKVNPKYSHYMEKNHSFVTK